jgi:hypothetical protein
VEFEKNQIVVAKETVEELGLYVGHEYMIDDVFGDMYLLSPNGQNYAFSPSAWASASQLRALGEPESKENIYCECDVCSEDHIHREGKEDPELQPVAKKKPSCEEVFKLLDEWNRKMELDIFVLEDTLAQQEETKTLTDAIYYTYWFSIAVSLFIFAGIML